MHRQRGLPVTSLVEAPGSGRNTLLRALVGLDPGATDDFHPGLGPLRRRLLARLGVPLRR